jgi:hypothetical protein
LATTDCPTGSKISDPKREEDAFFTRHPGNFLATTKGFEDVADQIAVQRRAVAGAIFPSLSGQL